MLKFKPNLLFWMMFAVLCLGGHAFAQDGSTPTNMSEWGLTIFFGVIVPGIAAFLNRSTFSATFKACLVLVISVIAAILQQWITGKLSFTQFDGDALLLAATGVLGMSQVIHRLFKKQLDKIEVATDPTVPSTPASNVKVNVQIPLDRISPSTPTIAGKLKGVALEEIQEELQERGFGIMSGALLGGLNFAAQSQPSPLTSTSTVPPISLSEEIDLTDAEETGVVLPVEEIPLQPVWATINRDAKAAQGA